MVTGPLSFQSKVATPVSVDTTPDRILYSNCFACTLFLGTFNSVGKSFVLALTVPQALIPIALSAAKSPKAV